MQKIITFLAAFIISLSASSKAFISGVVRDSLTNEALPGAFVMYEEGKGTATDLDGAYRLQLPAGTYTLKCAFVGMESKTERVSIGSADQVVDFSSCPGRP